jgi:glycosyltransferase involved in cell wall biosynthesis
MNYNFIDGPVKPKTVTVITPTTGSVKLEDAVESVKNQTYEHVQHLIIVDGPKAADNLAENIPMRPSANLNLSSYVLHENTGANGFYGHRIYAAFPHLINSDYIFFLDEDNWYEPNHVETLVKTLEEGNDFAYSLRKIYDPEKNYLCEDNCESLGKWPIYFTHEKPEYLIDTSSFAFRREFLIRVCQFWHHGWGGDRHFFYNVKDFAKYDTSGKHTLCYRLDGNPKSVNEEFFIRGNESQRIHYEGIFPWMK